MSKLADLRRAGRNPLRSKCFRATQWAASDPPIATPSRAVIDAALRAIAGPAERQLVRVRGQRQHPPRRPFGTSGRRVELVAWRDGDGHAARRSRRLPAPGRRPVDRHRRRRRTGLPVARAAAGRAAANSAGSRIRHTTTVCWPGCGWTASAAETPTEAPVLPRAPRRRAATRRHPAGRHLRAARHHRQPARSVARRLVSPLLVHAAGGAQRTADDYDVAEESDRFLVAVTFRIGRLGVPVVAEFTSPEPRTIVMRIVDGEGAGSVVETHATPVGPGPDGRPRTAVLEAVIAHSDRRASCTRCAARRLIMPLMRPAATRLWRDDLAYAERLFALRNRANPQSESRKVVGYAHRQWHSGHPARLRPPTSTMRFRQPPAMGSVPPPTD